MSRKANPDTVKAEENLRRSLRHRRAADLATRDPELGRIIIQRCANVDSMEDALDKERGALNAVLKL